MARLSDIGKVSAVFNANTGEFKEYSQPKTFSGAGLGYNHQSSGNAPNFGWGDNDWTAGDYDNSDNTTKTDTNTKKPDTVTRENKTNNAGLYLALGVILFIFFTNK